MNTSNQKLTTKEFFLILYTKQAGLKHYFCYLIGVVSCAVLANIVFAIVLGAFGVVSLPYTPIYYTRIIISTVAGTAICFSISKLLYNLFFAKNAQSSANVSN